MKTLARICKVYKEKYPLVQIVLHTATADTVYESKWNNKKSGRDDCRGSKSRFTSGGSGFGNTVKEFREWVKSLEIVENQRHIYVTARNTGKAVTEFLEKANQYNV